MNRAALQEALKVCREFSQVDRRFPPGTRLVRVKQLEHVATQPVLRRQRIFNGAVVTVLDSVVKSAENANQAIADQADQASHHEAVAELRRDLVALQQEVARLTARLEAGLVSTPE
jgi:uncharacterized small protein (DUF1192 family)